VLLCKYNNDQTLQNVVSSFCHDYVAGFDADT
jgi:hypothetical protein